jgi:hypothetical protein
MDPVRTGVARCVIDGVELSAVIDAWIHDLRTGQKIQHLARERGSRVPHSHSPLWLFLLQHEG